MTTVIHDATPLERLQIIQNAKSVALVGVSANVIDASYNALHDAITWKLFHDGVRT